MNRELFTSDGLLVERTVNNNDGTGTHTTFDADGNVTSETTLTGLPIIPPFDPLDATGALATLLVVEGVLDIDDAANALHEQPAHLEHEAQAWAL
jgi:YD repeat-containing protein